jgi:hypothetical protein
MPSRDGRGILPRNKKVDRDPRLFVPLCSRFRSSSRRRDLFVGENIYIEATSPLCRDAIPPSTPARSRSHGMDIDHRSFSFSTTSRRGESSTGNRSSPVQSTSRRYDSTLRSRYSAALFQHVLWPDRLSEDPAHLLSQASSYCDDGIAEAIRDCEYKT